MSRSSSSVASKRGLAGCVCDPSELTQVSLVVISSGLSGGNWL
ncbi:MAG: hypothetical protein ACOC0J_00270 [Myxococcota bacterium]